MQTTPRLVLIGVFACLYACLQKPEAGPAAAIANSTIEPTATVLELHQTMITPASDTIFNAGLEPLKDAAAWTVVRNDALILAESGNLLMLGSRAKDTGTWMEMSKALVDAAVVARKQQKRKI